MPDRVSPGRTAQVRAGLAATGAVGTARALLLIVLLLLLILLLLLAMLVFAWAA
jgi:tetrahydromethanopterin S-methyltransferase subunit F